MTDCGHERNLTAQSEEAMTTARQISHPYFRLYDLRSTYATRLSAGGVADEWVTQLLRQTDAQMFKKYSRMKLQMKHEALTKLNRKASESGFAKSSGTEKRCKRVLIRF
jgi:integrase